MDVRDTVVEVDLWAIAHNLRELRKRLEPKTAVMAVIKADAYGHGAIAVAPTLMENGADYLGVATLSEALELRDAYPDYPVIIIGHTPDRLLHICVERDITMTVFRAEQGRIISEAAETLGKAAKIHLKVDSGLHRLGAVTADELWPLCTHKNVLTEGIFTHLALLSDEDDTKQVNFFLDIVNELERRGARFRYKHVSDSYAAVQSPWFGMDMVRVGALLYGTIVYERNFIDLRQAIRFYTRISCLHTIPKGEGVGYDRGWRAERESRVATLPFGYSDGFPRNVPNAYVVIKGVKCPIRGLICMDQCMADVTDVPDVHEGDLALIYGDGSDGALSIRETAARLSTNKNELLSLLSLRAPHVYKRGDDEQQP